LRPLAEAQRDLLDALPLLPEVTVGAQEALGLALRRSVEAPHDVPPFPNSAMDGFAVLAGDVAEAPVELLVLEDVPAGSVPTRSVGTGAAIKIMTGAPMPAGADCVVKVEDTEATGNGTVRILSGAAEGENVRPAGGDLVAGAPVFSAGTRLEPAHVGVLASLGVSPVVGRRPVVAVGSTGDELVPPDAGDLAPGKIRDTNRPMLLGLLSGLGVDTLDLGIIPDDADRLRNTLESASATADAVVTSGGVSMGEYDLVKHVLVELGTIDFWRVAMQPAKPFAFGSIGQVPFFGLPGNPVSVFVAFEQFLRPGLLAMMGANEIFRRRVIGTAAEDLDTDPAKEVFLRAALEATPQGVWSVRTSGGQSSNVLSALAAADAFAVVPVGTSTVPEGSPVTLEMFRWPEARTRQEVLGD
jgi:molybdenum cofactor synthesis domain-containing protein